MFVIRRIFLSYTSTPYPAYLETSTTHALGTYSDPALPLNESSHWDWESVQQHKQMHKQLEPHWFTWTWPSGLSYETGDEENTNSDVVEVCWCVLYLWAALCVRAPAGILSELRALTLGVAAVRPAPDSSALGTTKTFEQWTETAGRFTWKKISFIILFIQYTGEVSGCFLKYREYLQHKKSSKGKCSAVKEMWSWSL